LLRSLKRNAPPTLHPLFHGLSKMLLSPPRNHRRQCGHSQLGGLLNRPLHAIELVNGYHQCNGQRWVGPDLGNQVEANLIGGHGRHFGMKHVSARHHVRLHARLGAQYASHVFGLRANDRGRGFIPVFGNPAASRHVRLHIVQFGLKSVPPA
jgi:hypothetical protein